MISRRTFLIGAGQLITAATLQRYVAAIGSGSGPVIDAPKRTDYELVVITGEWSHMIGLWQDGLPVWGDSGSPYAEAYKLLHDLDIGEKLRGRNGEVGGLDFVQKVYKNKGLQISARCAGRGAGQKDLSISLHQAYLRDVWRTGTKGTFRSRMKVKQVLRYNILSRRGGGSTPPPP